MIERKVGIDPVGAGSVLSCLYRHLVVGALALLAILGGSMHAQELFPNTEPASNIPSGVLGARFSSEIFDEVGQVRSWQALRMMYGLTPDLMVTGGISFSNHHGRTLPSEFISNDGTAVGPHTHGVRKGKPYPYLFETFNLNLKYRFLVMDGPSRHFRGAVWAEGAIGDRAHDEAEPSLLGDNSGFAAGLIFTQLYHRFAASVGFGGILPLDYEESQSGIKLSYGKLLQYSLSLGYLLFPLEYEDYNQINFNIYTEFMGHTYGTARAELNGKELILSRAPTLEAGHYLEFRPGIQFIFGSTLRVDLSTSFLIGGQAYTKLYPVQYINIQNYFFI